MWKTQPTMQTKLGEFLDKKRKEQSYRRLETDLGVSKGSLENIINGDIKGYPKLETLIKIAEVFDLKVYQVIEMAGVDLGIPYGMRPRPETPEQYEYELNRWHALQGNQATSIVSSWLARILGQRH